MRATFPLVVLVSCCQSAGRDAGPAATSTAAVVPAIAALKVPLTVRDVAGVGATSYPVSAIVPLPQGRYQDASRLTVIDGEGKPVPAQVEVINRHFAKDGSLRHVKVRFTASVGPKKDAEFFLDDSGRNILPAKPLKVSEASGAITIDTGAIEMKITERPFSILTPSGPLIAELVTAEGKKERSFDAPDVSVVIEERGPLVAVIRAESPAKKGNHGWAVRIYAYAGERFIAADYQLQNSPKELFGAPLYFDSLGLALDTGAKSKPIDVRADALESDPIDRPAAVLVTPTVQVAMRHFWEMWPNALTLDARGRVSAELFPAWGTRRFQGKPSPLGLHWLDDMQHVVKETLFRFGDPAGFEALAANFALHPVVTIPVAWYSDTEVTLDMGGVFPRRERFPDSERRRKPNYAKYRHGDRPVPLRFGWDNFGVDLYRKGAPNTTGDWAYSSAACFLSEDPADFYAAEDFAMGELNVLPSWVADYQYARDFPKLMLTENPYGSFSWRHFDGKHGYQPGAGYRPGSGQEAKPRDDQHGWFYHLEEAYYCSGNPWIKDYYRFAGQFRRTRLHQKDPFPDMSSRAIGHTLSHALQAYRVTGDTEILTLVGNYLRDILAPRMDPETGGYKEQAEAIFQFGYLGRAIVSYLSETKERDPVALELLGGMVRWNMKYGNFGYYTEPKKPFPKSDATGIIFCDPESWYGIFMNDRAVLAHVEGYMKSGINGGERPPLDLTTWTGDFNGRVTAAAMQLLRE